MDEDRYAKKLAFGKRIDDLLTYDDDFVSGLCRTDDGEFSIVIADWFDTMADVFGHIDHVEAPATLLIERGDAIIGFTMSVSAAEGTGAGDSRYPYNPTEPLKEFLHYVIETGPSFLDFPEPIELPSRDHVGQLALDLGPIRKAS